MKKLLFLLSLFLSLASIEKASGQSGLTSTTTLIKNQPLPKNRFVRMDSCCLAPRLRYKEINKLISRTTFLNVSTYGATPNDATNDIVDIEQALNAAADAARGATVKRRGVRFNQAGVYMLSSPNTSTNEQVRDIDLTGVDTFIIDMRGATLRAADKSRYSFLSLNYPEGQYNGCVIIIGGTLDGNQTFQIYPTNPRGGEYSPAPVPAPGPDNETNNQNFVEAHGRFIGVKNADFVLFMDLNVINTVVDGPTSDDCNFTIFADSRASGGAQIHYNDEGQGTPAVYEQGTYFKSTGVRTKTTYFLNLDCEGGSIATHMSFPTSQQSIIDTSGLSFHYKCNIRNQVQDGIHLEDCAKNFIVDCQMSAATNHTMKYKQRIHVSNMTRLFGMFNCDLVNSRVDLVQATNLQLAIVDSCRFTSTYTDNWLETFVYNVTNVSSSTFDGRVAIEQVFAKYANKSTFRNFTAGGQVALRGAITTDSCRFINGVTAISFNNPNVYHTTYSSVTNTRPSTTPTGTAWYNPFRNRINFQQRENNISKYIGALKAN